MAEGAAIRVVAASGSVLNPSRTWPAGGASLRKRHSIAAFEYLYRKIFCETVKIFRLSARG